MLLCPLTLNPDDRLVKYFVWLGLGCWLRQDLCGSSWRRPPGGEQRRCSLQELCSSAHLRPAVKRGGKRAEAAAAKVKAAREKAIEVAKEAGVEPPDLELLAAEASFAP